MVHDTQAINALSVDVEDYFQVSAFTGRVTRSMWDRMESRVERNTDLVLQILDTHGVRGTFFILGWVAERYPQLVKRIAKGGHELASHGYWHQLVYELTPEAFEEDIIASRDAIEAAVGIRVTAYRAPSFSITGRSLWALEFSPAMVSELTRVFFPLVAMTFTGFPMPARRFTTSRLNQGASASFRCQSGVRGRVHVPIGGGYFRLFPRKLTFRAIDAVHSKGRPVMFYTHPWSLIQSSPKSVGLDGRVGLDITSV